MISEAENDDLMVGQEYNPGIQDMDLDISMKKNV